MAWFITRDRKTNLGPFTSDEIREMVRKGELLRSDWMLKEGERTWHPAGTLVGLFPDEAESAPLAASEPPPDENAKIDRRRFWKIKLPCVLCLLAVVAWVVSAIGFAFQFPPLMLPGPIATLILAVMFYGATDCGCTQCGAYWGKIGRQKTQVGAEQAYGLVTRTSSTSLSGSSGKDRVHLSGSTTWKERVPVLKITYLVFGQCWQCGHKMQWNKTVEKEDFSKQ